ncbi:actin depolymerizing factor [Reticulomyxa filosa]|uniref:Actin depolymerizing factor n=1 Tax=Reticulomyxa filosa TaxID=46433 RepID=X6PFZ6_RETFI|nr:actin depolymerizing factor [Reticulomyxa filosa]|eukprot:ETO36944.1 actin depolymerizing factor [Reticulomyxa filosa]
MHKKKTDRKKMLAIKAEEAALSTFNEMKLGKKHAFILFKIDDNKVVVETSVLKTDCKDPANYLDDFISGIKKSGAPRFAVLDWNHKLLFVSWVPDTSKASDKMKYASVKESFTQELVGVQIKLAATDDGELSKSAINEKTKSNTTCLFFFEFLLRFVGFECSAIDFHCIFFLKNAAFKIAPRNTFFPKLNYFLLKKYGLTCCDKIIIAKQKANIYHLAHNFD